MKIALDVSCLARPDRTGVGVYAASLIEALARLDSENDYFLCYRFSRLKHRKHFPAPPGGNFRTKIIQEPLNVLFPRKLDVFHGVDARLPAYRGVKKVVTLHDVFSLISSDFSDEAFISKKRSRYRELARSADRVIAVSRSTRDDVIEHLGIPAERIAVIPHGVDPRYRPADPDAASAAAARHGIAGPYLLFVGSISARKNLVRMLEAFAALPAALRDATTFVMAGKVTYGGEEALAAVERLGLKDRVRHLGFVPHADLPALYAGASVFMFPTLYEGFGLPILEAMACGTPVVASNLSSHPEVAGGAALLVDPSDRSAIAAATARLLEDESLRAECIAKGYARAKGFTWERAARQTLALYGVGGEESAPDSTSTS
jgi:glycosyltransferase involved in cell wall biosynthesis